VRVESPVGWSPLGRPQFQELLAPPPVRLEREPLHDEPVNRFQHQHLGQDELTLGGRLQLGSRLIAQTE
jgi:hypothetical protein